MICLTADIHHSSLETGNQQHSDKSEPKLASYFARMLEEASVKSTFFISGKTLEEELSDIRPVFEIEGIEVGGHNYSCFTPEIVHRISKKIFGSYNGPYWMQKRDAQKTIELFYKYAGKELKSCRNHMYMHGPHTERVLSELGIKICSDGVRLGKQEYIKNETGIINFPINVIPDHEHIYHAERTKEWVDKWVKRYNWSDDFGSESYDIAEWAEIVLENLKENEEKGVVSNLIIHPITMYLADNFKAFDKILQYIESKTTLTMEDYYQYRNLGSY